MLNGILLVILVLLAILAAAAVMLLSSRKKPDATFPYQKEATLFSPAERSFLGVLDQALGPELRVMGKVRLTDLLKVRAGLNGKDRQSAFNKIKSKHVDFVICNTKDLAIQYVVELDDQSHDRARRQGRDAFVDQALQAAGVPVHHFRVKPSYAVGEVQKALTPTEPPREQTPQPSAPSRKKS